jgi:NAD(P)H dehydrogenase (quinone)
MNGDKQGTLTTLFTLAMQHGMMWVSQGLMPSNTKAAPSATTSTTSCRTAAPSRSRRRTPGRAMSPGDLETGRQFGARVAAAAARWAAK